MINDNNNAAPMVHRPYSAEIINEANAIHILILERLLVFFMFFERQKTNSMTSISSLLI